MIIHLLLVYLLRFQTDAKKECRRYPVDKMQPFRYVSLSASSPQVYVEILAQPDQLDAGASGQIFIGYTGKKTSSNQKLPHSKCVAIKIYREGNEREFRNGVTILNNLKNDEMSKKHIIDMLDYGVINGLGHLTILELGDMSFEQELHRGKTQRSRDELKSLIKDLLNPLVVLHKSK
uniref:Protein kinase domain-containing protein n=1 Tax=Globodera pallida TaxID=36090 RepID=A0A183C5B6_GLOPA